MQTKMAFTGIPTRLPLQIPPLQTPRLCRARPARTPSHRTRVTSQLIGMPEGFGKSIEPDDNEVLLAEFRFSEPDKLPSLVQNSLPSLDETFYAFLEEKINQSSDLEERDTLATLRDAITDVMKQLHDASLKEDDIAAARAASEHPSAATLDVSADSSDVADATYDELIDKLLGAGPGPDLTVAVNAAYERIDMRFLERLTERIAAGADDATQLKAVRDVITATMNERVATASEALRSVLATGEPTAMRKEIGQLTRKGKVDDAFLLLLQANVEQATKAGAEQAVQVMKMLLDHAGKIKEIGLDPEIKLIRALLRTEDSAARMEMLMEGLKPRQAVTLVDGSATSGVKVDGKQFVRALRKLIEEFGNVDEKFVLKLSAIGEESEAVARKLLDMEGKDIEDLQNEAFHKRSVSIWDLERIEVEEEVQGRQAAWEGRLGAIPEGFDEDGKKQV